MEASGFSDKVRVLSVVLKVDAVCSATKDYRYSKGTPLNLRFGAGFPPLAVVCRTLQDPGEV
jgi:hypothetical protein